MGKGNIYLWTGEGGGKSTSAFGVALRAIGHKKKVVIVQFMKGRKDIGEYKIMEKLKPYYRIYQFGTEKFVDLGNPSEEDRRLARNGLEFAKRSLRERPFLLILDEINLAAAIGLVKVTDVIKILNKAPKETNVYLTGRSAPPDLIEKSDYVTIFTPQKYPPTDPKKSKQGIDY